MLEAKELYNTKYTTYFKREAAKSSMFKQFKTGTEKTTSLMMGAAHPCQDPAGDGGGLVPACLQLAFFLREALLFPVKR